MKTINFSKRILVTLAIALLCCFSAKAQISPSVYAGLVNYTNLGGVAGIGTELRYKSISANAAIGSTFYYGRLKGKEKVGNPYLGFDVGLKYYFYKGFFGGVNYGVLGKHLMSETSERVRLKSFYGFSFTLGYKWHYYKGIYGMTYLGATSSKDANKLLGDFGGFEPRLGLILSYEFKH